MIFQTRIASRPTLQNSFQPTARFRSQRKCACGGTPGPSGECEECRKKRLQRKVAQPSSLNHQHSEVPPIVHEVLRSPGQPLDSATRAFMEARFGHDFNEVRVHTDVRAAKSARAVDAHAYTAGRDLVFGDGLYAPGMAAGRRLLAHELAHVVQQGSRVTAAPLPTSISGLADPLEEEAAQAAKQIDSNEPIDGSQREDSAAGALHRQTIHLPPTQPFGPIGPISPPLRPLPLLPPSLLPPTHLAPGPLPTLPKLEVPKWLQSVPAACDHHAPLAWADFTGAVAANDPLSAHTHFHYDLATVGTVTIIKAFFDPARSAVKPQFANPTKPAVSGCSARISECERHFDAKAKAGLTKGVFWRLTLPPGCPASEPYNPAVVARTRSDCSDPTVIPGECERQAILESERLLRHEQRHYDLACALATKGSLAIMGGGAAADMLKAVRAASATQTAKYDNETAHGCNAAPQAAWSTNIDGGLPSVNLP